MDQQPSQLNEALTTMRDAGNLADAQESVEPTQAEADLVKEWWDKTSSAVELEAAVTQWYQDGIILDGGKPEEIADENKITTQHVYRNVIQTVAMTAPGMKDINFKPRKQVEIPKGFMIPAALREQIEQLQRTNAGVAACMKTLFDRYGSDCNWEETIEEFILQATAFPAGIIKVWWQDDLESDPISETRINDEQDLVAHVEQAVEDFNNREFDSTDSEMLEIEHGMDSIGRTESPHRRGIRIEVRPINSYRIDPAVTSVAYKSSARWESDDVPMSRDEILATFPTLTRDDLLGAGVYDVDEIGRWKRKELEDRTNNRHSSDSIAIATSDPVHHELSGNDWLLVREVYDYQFNRRRVMIEGVRRFVVEEPLENGPLGQSRFVVLVLNPRPGYFYGYSGCQMTGKIQAMINAMRSDEEQSRDDAKPRFGIDSSHIADPDDIKNAFSAKPRSVSVIRTAGGKDKLADAIFDMRGNHDHNPAEYDDTKLQMELRKMAALPEQASGVLGTAQFATEVQMAAQGANALASFINRKIRRSIQLIGKMVGELIAQNITKEDVIRECGPAAMVLWPDDMEQIVDAFGFIQVDVDPQTDKELHDQNRLTSLSALLEALAAHGIRINPEYAGKLLTKFAGFDHEASDLMELDPNEIVARLETALMQSPETVTPEAMTMLMQMGQYAAEELAAMQQEAVMAEQDNSMNGADVVQQSMQGAV